MRKNSKNNSKITELENQIKLKQEELAELVKQKNKLIEDAFNFKEVLFVLFYDTISTWIYANLLISVIVMGVFIIIIIFKLVKKKPLFQQKDEFKTVNKEESFDKSNAQQQNISTQQEEKFFNKDKNNNIKTYNQLRINKKFNNRRFFCSYKEIVHKSKWNLKFIALKNIIFEELDKILKTGVLLATGRVRAIEGTGGSGFGGAGQDEDDDPLFPNRRFDRIGHINDKLTNLNFNIEDINKILEEKKRDSKRIILRLQEDIQKLTEDTQVNQKRIKMSTLNNNDLIPALHNNNNNDNVNNEISNNIDNVNNLETINIIPEMSSMDNQVANEISNINTNFTQAVSLLQNVNARNTQRYNNNNNIQPLEQPQFQQHIENINNTQAVFLEDSQAEITSSIELTVAQQNLVQSIAGRGPNMQAYLWIVNHPYLATAAILAGGLGLYYLYKNTNSNSSSHSNISTPSALAPQIPNTSTVTHNYNYNISLGLGNILKRFFEKKETIDSVKE